MRRHLIALTVGSVLALVLVEVVALRGVLGYRGIADLAIIQRDVEIGWSIAPNARAWHAALDFGLWVQSDELGFRVPLSGRAASTSREGTQQILVLGDSFAFGWGVPAERMFAAELERQLSSRGRPYSVRTAGVPGYSTDQEYLLWQRLTTTLHPAQVVLLFHQSDPPANIRDTAVMGRFVFSKPRFQLREGRLHVVGVPVPDKRALTPDTVFEPVKQWLRPLAIYAFVQWAFRAEWRMGGGPQGNGRPVPLDPGAYTMTAALLAALDADVRSHGATFLVALVPTDPVMTKHLATICRTLGIAFLDLQPAFNNQADVLLVHDRHWNGKGHAIAARAVAPLVR